MRTFLIASALLLSSLTPVREALAATQQNQASTAIVVQGFHWNSASYSNPNWYSILQGKAADLQGMGFTHIWLPPPSDSGSAQGYLPRQLSLLNSSYGSATDLQNTVSAFTSRGLKVIADIVINHRVGTTGWYDFTNPAWGTNSIVNNDECGCGTGAADTGDGYSAARDLDHTASVVQTGLESWMSTSLKANGFTGMRFDFAKGYGAAYAKIYHDYWNPDFCVGEIWTTLSLSSIDAHRQTEVNWVDGTSGACAAFDFTTKGLLNEVLANNDYGYLKDANGNPAGLIGWWAQKSVTFVDNHDTGPAESCSSGQNLWPVPCSQVMQGYAYILTHPGIPTVFYPHIYDWNLKSQLQPLINVRKSQGITSTSNVRILVAQNGLYADLVNNNNTVLKMGPNSWSAGTGYTLAASGTNYSVWTTGCTVPVTFSISNANTSLGQNLYVVGNTAPLGNWTPAQSFGLTIQGSGANATWSGTVYLPAGTALQYKYVKYDGTTAVWESNFATTSGNRQVTTAACGGSSTFNDGNFHF